MSAAPGVPRPWLPWVPAVALASALAAWNAWTRCGQLLGPVEDETLLVPIALHQTGLAAFAGDRWLATVAPIFSIPYSWIVGTLLRAFDDPVIALRILAFPFHVLFLAGTWRVAESVAGRAAAVVTVLLCALPPLSALVLAPGAGLPRDLVFALVPWFVLGAQATRTRTRAAIAVCFALGVVANLHPLTALHAIVWLLLVEVACDRTVHGAGRAAVRGIAFATGSAPYVVQYLSRPAAAGAVDAGVYAWRLEAMAGETFGPWAARMEPLLWLVAAAAVLAIALRRGGPVAPRWLVAAAGIALLLAAAGPVLARWIGPLRTIQLGRFERFADWTMLIALAAAGTAAARSRRFAVVAVAAALVAVALWGPALMGGVPPRGPVARLGRKLDRDAGVPFAPPAPSGLVTRNDVADPALPATRDDFLAVCSFARDTSAPGAVFIVPPEQWGAFRVYGRRALSVTRKEGGAALSFLGGAGMQWYRDYAQAVRVYGQGGPSDWEALAYEWGASYTVTDPSTGSPPAWPVVFEAGKFRVLSAPRK